MPTVLRIGPYRFYFYPYDILHEPPHIHVGRDQDEAKFGSIPSGWNAIVDLQGMSFEKLRDSFVNMNLNV